MTGASREAAPTSSLTRAPAWFLAHGSPMLAIQDVPVTRRWARLGREAARPRAVVAVSAHWQTRGGLHVTAAARPATIHDFGGFDPALHTVTYPAPGDGELAARVAAVLRRAGIPAQADASRGLDHGTWVPLRHVYPGADVPVVQLSLPYAATPLELARVGRALAPLRDEGVLLLGSGGLVHNLGTVDMGDEDAPVPPWARELDAWFGARFAADDWPALLDYRGQAPHAALGVPTAEHLDPLFVVLGSRRPDERARTLFEGFQHGTLSLRSVELAAG